MKKTVLIFLAAMMASGAHSQTIEVRSGEHQAFTRLVFTMPTAETKWSLQGQNKNFSVTFDVQNPVYSASTVFDRIPRTRLIELRAKDGDPSVALKLGCDCTVRAFGFGVRGVVLDITEQDNKKSAAKPRSVEVDKPNFLPTSEARNIESSFDDPENKEKWLGISRFVSREAELSLQRTSLAESIARAASQGMATPSVPIPKAETRKLPIASKSNQENVPVVPIRATNIKAQTAFEQAFESVTTQFPSSGCLPDSILDISSWGKQASLSDLQSEYRQKLTNDRGDIKPDAALDLARAYVYFSFGAEAIQVLNLISKNQETEILRALAYLMDDSSKESFDTFFGQEQCEGKVALWSALSGHKIRSDAQVQSILRNFESLPAHLRIHLGRHLADTLLKQNRVAAADLIYEIVDRVSEGIPSHNSLTQAKVEIAEGSKTLAEQRLSDIVQDGSRLTPEALIELISLHNQNDFAPSQDIIALISAYAVEQRRGPLGAKLRDSNAIARALGGNFNAAFEVLSEVQELDGEPAAKDLASELTIDLAAKATDFQVIETTSLFKLGTGQKINKIAALALAERLVDIGFILPASRIIENNSLGLSENDRLLRAKLALAEGHYRRAEAEVLGLDSDKAIRLRAQARGKAGDYERAAEAYKEINEGGEAERQLWLAADWKNLTSGSDPVHRLVAKSILQGLESTDKTTNGQLAQSRELLDASSVVRDYTKALKEMHEVSSE